MEINGNINVNSQTVSTLRSETDKTNKETLDSEQVSAPVNTERPVTQAKEINEDIVNERVAEHQAQASGTKITADQAVGSLIDVSV